MKKILIIRFSSFGDIIQCMTIIDDIKKHFPTAKIHWAVRQDYAPFLALHPHIDQLHILDRNTGTKGLFRFAHALKRQKFSAIYDAHCNLRSHILAIFLYPIQKRILNLCTKEKFFIRRKKFRLKRWLFFTFRWDLFPLPFYGAYSFQKPLQKWGISHIPATQCPLIFPDSAEKKVKTFLRFVPNHQKCIALVPSAAWDLKRWPIDHWQQLITLLPSYYFIILGGPADHFCEDIAHTDPVRVKNSAGYFSLVESATAISCVDAVVAGDTGLLHMADLLNKPTIALMGPSAFGHPCGIKTHILETNLSCKPCTKDGRGTCSHSEYKHCLRSITPLMVADKIKDLL